MENLKDKTMKSANKDDGAGWLEESPTEEEKKVCMSFKNPCFWINCRYHLRPEDNIWEKLTETEKLKKLFSLEETCCLRFADKKGGIEKQDIAHHLGLSSRVIEGVISKAERRIRRSGNLLMTKMEYHEGK